MFRSNCGGIDIDACRDDTAAFYLKLIGIASILLSGVGGVAIPLVGRHSKFLPTDGSLFALAKAFAAGVILATGFVHMLAGGTDALSDPCLAEFLWSKFPFAGFFAMLAALMTLLVDFVGTKYYEQKQGLVPDSGERVNVGSIEAGLESSLLGSDANRKVFGEEGGGAIHIVGIRAHAAHHGHSHSQAQGACVGIVTEQSQLHGHGHSHGHSHGSGAGDEDTGVRHVVVSQILELGIVSHSVIIGLSLGVSQSPCTIRPLIAALSFHQFFEGFALGGCISQAQFKTSSSIMMACFFAITTPLGIGIGTATASFYNPNSPGALIAEGILDSLSAGILIYMALVDLIAADFLSKSMSCNFRLQLVSFLMIFLGAGMMASLAIWA